MDASLTESWFVVVFEQKLTVELVEKSADRTLSLRGELFTPVDDNFLTAFVDRLVDERGELVGITIAPVSDAAAQLMSSVKSAPYVTSEAGAFQIWFGEAPLEKVRNTAEQAFGGQIFRSTTGVHALSIDAASLFTEGDRKCLLDLIRSEGEH
jgi:hypothetical protein